MFDYPSDHEGHEADKAAIIGLGGAGNNVLNKINQASLPDCSFYSVNLDLRLLKASTAPHKIHLGESLTHGLGSGGDPLVASKAATEDAEALTRALKDCNLVILLAGLGGGTGSGATPVIARLAKERNIYVVSIVTMPFTLEGSRRKDQAKAALAELQRYSDAVLCFENDLAETLLQGKDQVLAAYEASNVLLARAAASIPMLICKPGLFHIGLDDLRAVVGDEGKRCLFGTGTASGEDRAVKAARQALSCPLFDKKANSQEKQEVLIHISGSDSLSISEIEAAVKEIALPWHGNAHIHFGVSILPELDEAVNVTVFAPARASIDAPVEQESVRSSERLPIAPAPGEEEVFTIPARTQEPEQPPVLEPEFEQEDLPEDEHEEDLNSQPEETEEEDAGNGEEASPARDPFREEVIIIESDVDPSDDLPVWASRMSHEETEDLSIEIDVDEPQNPQFDLDLPDENHPTGERDETRSYDRDYMEPSFKGLFSDDDPFIVDGEDLDLPPSMRKKKP